MARKSAVQRFSAEIQKVGVNPYVEVPPRVSGAFAPAAVAGRIRVAGTISGAPVHATLVPVRGGGHRLYVNGGMRAAAGLRVGDVADFALYPESPHQATVPPDVAAALGDHAGAFAALAVTQQRELLRYVEAARTPATRQRRVADLVGQLTGRNPEVPMRPDSTDRPLWTCPDCGNSFVTRNMNHSCARHSLDDAFAGKPTQIRALFDRLRSMVETVGPVTLVAYRDRVAFMGLVRFAGATPRRQWLDVGLWLARRVDSPRMHKVETLTPQAHIHTLRITDVEQLDGEVAGWLAEAYAVGQREHLRSAPARGAAGPAPVSRGRARPGGRP